MIVCRSVAEEQQGHSAKKLRRWIEGKFVYRLCWKRAKKIENKKKSVTVFRMLNTQANKSSIIAIASMLLKYLPTLYKR